jgi:hypothetical protein
MRKDWPCNLPAESDAWAAESGRPGANASIAVAKEANAARRPGQSDGFIACRLFAAID